ncbi:MAG: hypothetical protein AAF633_05275 [Chloroflexota bacterium]
MTLSISLSQSLEAKLKRKAEQRKVRPEQLAHDLLELALDESDLDLPSMEELVRKIRALPKDKNVISLPKASLADALRGAPTDPNFDLDTWESEWARAEKELEKLNRNDN